MGLIGLKLLRYYYINIVTMDFNMRGLIIPLAVCLSCLHKALAIAVFVSMCSSGLSSAESSLTDAYISSNMVPMFNKFRSGKLPLNDGKNTNETVHGQLLLRCKKYLVVLTKFCWLKKNDYDDDYYNTTITTTSVLLLSPHPLLCC